MTVTYATVIRWVDGDTFIADLHVAGSITIHKVSLRLKGVDCPELRGAQRLYGMRAREFVKKNYPQGTKLEIDEIFPQKDKYGRWVVTARVNGVEIAQILIANKLGVPI
jgi:endonuclease YncB( thermonuclease family)